MFAYLYAFFIIMPLFLFLTKTIFVKLEWRGVWKGKQVQIIRNSYKTSLLIDGKEVCGSKFSKKPITTEFEDPEHGTVSIFMNKQADMLREESDYQLVLDGEVVPLIQVPTDWKGHRIPNSLPALKEKIVAEEAEISDPRYAATTRVFEVIATELGDDHENAVAIVQLHTEIKEHILIAERMKQSTMDYSSLGHMGDDIEVVKEQIELRIHILLSALQEIHLAVVKRNLSSRTQVLERVEYILNQIEADIDVEKSIKKSRKKKAMRQKNTDRS